MDNNVLGHDVSSMKRDAFLFYYCDDAVIRLNCFNANIKVVRSTFLDHSITPKSVKDSINLFFIKPHGH